MAKPHEHNETPMNQCGAKTRAGTPCKRKPLPNGRCNLHGGKTPRGVALPQTKHGRYSKDLPARLGERFEAALGDADLVQLGRDIALIDSRLGEILGEITQDSTGAIFSALQKAWNKYTRAPNPVDKQAAFSDMGMLIEQGADDWLKWQEVYNVIEQRRRLVESEAKRQIQLQQTLTASQAMMLLAAITETVKKHVRDADALRAISADIAGLVNVGAVGRA